MAYWQRTMEVLLWLGSGHAQLPQHQLLVWPLPPLPGLIILVLSMVIHLLLVVVLVIILWSSLLRVIRVLRHVRTDVNGLVDVLRSLHLTRLRLVDGKIHSQGGLVSLGVVTCTSYSPSCTTWLELWRESKQPGRNHRLNFWSPQGCSLESGLPGARAV